MRGAAYDTGGECYAHGATRRSYRDINRQLGKRLLNSELPFSCGKKFRVRVVSLRCCGKKVTVNARAPLAFERSRKELR